MTPAINAAKRAKIAYSIHEYEHESSASSYGLEAAEKMNVAAERIFKTLVVEDDKKNLAVAIIPVSSSLNMKKMAVALACKKTAMADKNEVQKKTGYVLGGVSPLGQKRPLRTVLDVSAKDKESIFVSAGRRGLEIELSPHDLLKLTKGSFADIQA